MEGGKVSSDWHLGMSRRSHLDLVLQLEGHHLQEIFSDFPARTDPSCSFGASLKTTV